MSSSVGTRASANADQSSFWMRFMSSAVNGRPDAICCESRVRMRSERYP